MSHINIAKSYELKYWHAHKLEPYHRAQKMLDLFEFPANVKIAADIGCGPRCGIFHQYKSKIMYAVDPLWSSYKKNKLDEIPQNVTIVQADAENFTLSKKADLIVSVNALDHSGSLNDSFKNIMNNLKPGGSFCLHVHMRSKMQLNKGHRMLITEFQIDQLFAECETINKRVYDSCPIENKPYRTYVSTFIK